MPRAELQHPEPGSRRRQSQLLALAALLPLAVHLVLYRCDVPLGKPGTLVYLYSPIVLRRLGALPAAVLPALLAALGTWLAGSRQRLRRGAGLLIAAAGALALGIWAFRAPPDHLRQHFFNMLSPSHDGAFLTEARRIADPRGYLRQFPRRAALPPERLKGTRVVSNPPGTTLLALAVGRGLRASPAAVRLLDRTLTPEGPLPAEVRARAIPALGFAWVLTGLWILSAPFIYLACRLFLPTGSATALSLACLISPMTLLFVPGKDPAQLLTVALPLWLWLWAYRARRVWPAAAAGGCFVLATMVSLVHVWVAAALWVACLLDAAHQPGRRRDLWLRNSLPALLGALLLAAALYLCCDWNVAASAWAPACAQGRVTRGPAAMPLLWQTLGIPLFLLFAGPALWAAGLWLPRGRARDRQARFGTYLLAAATTLMLLTVGFTNLETARLWIPFVPLLLLGAGLQLRLLRGPGAGRSLLLAALVLAQVAVSAAQWSLMDMRESETRLLADNPRFFG